MSRAISHEGPLSDEDRDYLTARSRQYEIDEIDALFPPDGSSQDALAGDDEAKDANPDFDYEQGEDEEDEDGEADEKDSDDESEDYSKWTNTRLKEEVKARNKDRDDDDKIHPEGKNKEALVAALEADDEDSAEDSGTTE